MKNNLPLSDALLLAAILLLIMAFLIAMFGWF
jgi:hypothetical protein